MKRNLAPFVLLQIASITSLISGSMVFIAIPWIALELTGTSTVAGSLGSWIAAGGAVDAIGVKPIYLALSLGVLVAGVFVATNKYIKELDS